MVLQRVAVVVVLVASIVMHVHVAEHGIQMYMEENVPVAENPVPMELNFQIAPPATVRELLLLLIHKLARPVKAPAVLTKIKLQIARIVQAPVG